MEFNFTAHKKKSLIENFFLCSFCWLSETFVRGVLEPSQIFKMELFRKIVNGF